MLIINITNARQNLYNLIVSANSDEPVFIVGKKANAILISEDDWMTIQEILYPNSVSNIIK